MQILFLIGGFVVVIIGTNMVAAGWDQKRSTIKNWPLVIVGTPIGIAGVVMIWAWALM